MTGQDLFELQTAVNGGDEAMLKIAAAVRKRLGSKAVAANATKEAIAKGKELYSFYAISTVKMEVKKSVEVEERC